METKTITHLNTKVWYRLLKVLFLLVFVAVLLVFNLVSFSSGARQLNQEKSIVQCNIQHYHNTIPEGYKSFSLKDLDLFLLANTDFTNYKDFYSDPTNEYDVKTILSKCSGVNDQSQVNLALYQIISDVQKDDPTISDTNSAVQKYNSEVHIAEANHATVNEAVSDAIDRLETYHSHQFDIKPVFSYFEAIKLFVWGNLVILIIFEVMRRAFYYIVLGKIKPTK